MACCVEYFPAAQSVQAAVPLTSLYLPLMQAEQSAQVAPVNPGLHVQLSLSVLVPGLFVLTGQFSHELLPTASLNLPSVHFSQVVCPMSGCDVPFGQLWHVA